MGYRSMGLHRIKYSQWSLSNLKEYASSGRIVPKINNKENIQ
jgi:hypothetical protein